MQSLSVHTAAVPGGFWLHWLTSQARYVRVLIPRRALRASCESPWRVSAKHRISGACFPLTTPFRTCFSPCEMARTADVQRLIGCLYTLRDYSILTCRFHGTGHLSARLALDMLSLELEPSGNAIAPRMKNCLTGYPKKETKSPGVRAKPAEQHHCHSELGHPSLRVHLWAISAGA